MPSLEQVFGYGYRSSRLFGKNFYLWDYLSKLLRRMLLLAGAYVDMHLWINQERDRQMISFSVVRSVSLMGVFLDTSLFLGMVS